MQEAIAIAKRQGRGSHSAEGANAPPTFGPINGAEMVACSPTFSEVKWLYGPFGDGKCQNFKDLH